MTEHRSYVTRFAPLRNQGFSLVELMIALAAGLVVSVAVVAFLMSSFKGNSEYVQSTRLTQELRNSLDLITRDLRRAGYDDKALANLSTNNVSPFSRIRLCDDNNLCAAAATPPNTCVIYAYDRTGGTPGAIDVATGEVRGLRRRERTVNGRPNVGVLEYAVSAGAVTPSCAGAGPNYNVFPTVCNSSSKWCALSDPTKLDISTFTLTDVGAAAGGEVQLRDINIVLQGRLAGSTEYTRGMRTSVRIRSDCYDASLANCSLSP